jgi:hypothetical protein|tara:strand:- start:793 stop:1539 length:747 start_codon:yes stop_codon:yes gene_type:complete
MKISFISQAADLIEHPVPIKKVVPDWYKKLENYLNNDEYQPTVKKCQPVLDSITMGYAILSPVDFLFRKKENLETRTFEIEIIPARLDILDKNIEQWMKDFNVGIQHHNQGQLSLSMVYPNEIPLSFKFLNPWIIKTPPGYSCLFTSPFNTEKRDIRLTTGIVDTDNFEAYTNFPFFLTDWDTSKSKSKMIKKGTPIALVFPFKRDDWQMNIVNDKHLKDKINVLSWKWFTTLIDTYRNKTWTRKNYK